MTNANPNVAPPNPGQDTTQHPAIAQEKEIAEGRGEAEAAALEHEAKGETYYPVDRRCGP